jgi:hypothetical protein
MRRVGIVIAIFTLFVSLCSAQQTATKNSPNLIDGSPGTTQSANNDHPLSLTGSGTTNYIPLWTNASNLTSSVIYQTRGQNVGIGTTTPVAKLDVNGGISTATKYQIGGTNVLSSTEFLGELSVGLGAGNAGSGNTFVGVEAGTEIASGFDNTFIGNVTGFSNRDGIDNTYIGWYAGQYGVSGTDNVFVGATAGNAGYGNQNVFLGSSAGYSSGGNNNVFIGWQAGDNNLTGSQDIYIGIQVNGSANESDTIRIGEAQYQSAAYIAGIFGSTSASGVPVYINSNGQLGTQTSSLRFKEQVRDMGDSTSALMTLRPVTFLYKPEYDQGDRTLQYGLIAEEVAKVYPELVAYDKGGQPYTVRYQYITTMLLNEVQKQYYRAAAQAEIIKAQGKKIDELEQRLSRIERLIPQTVAQK